MGSNLFQKVFELIDTTLGTYIFDTAGNIISFVTPIFNSLMIIWIAIWGYMMIMGQTNEPLKEGLFRILRLTFIMALGLTLGTYVGLVVHFFAHGPEQIAAAVTGSPPGSMATTLDNLYTKVFQITDSCFEKANLWDMNIGMFVIGFAFLIIGTALLLSVAFFIISAKIMTAVLLGVGPIFIVLLLFKGTQRFFESWLSMVCNYGMILILTSGLGLIALDLANSFLSKLGFPDGATAAEANVYADSIAHLSNISMLIIVFGLTVLLMLQVPSIAAALGGGIALATQGIVSSTMNVMRPASIRHNAQQVQRELRSVRNAAGKGTQAFKKTFGRGNSITGS